MRILYDVAVIGNAVLGLSTAYQLKKAEPGLKIVVIGPAARPHAATTTAGAMINVWAEVPREAFVFPALSDRAELGLRALEMWDALAAELSAFSPVNIRWGTYIFTNARSTAMEVANMEYIVKVMAGGKIPHEEVNPGSVPWFNPRRGAHATRMVRIPDGRVDPKALLNAYEKALAVKGVELINDTVAKVETGSAFRLRLAGGGEVAAGQILFANGTFAQSLIDQIPELKKETPRLLWGGGSAIELSFPEWVHQSGGLDRNIFDMDAVIRTLDRGGSCGVHMVPQEKKGDYYLGASSGVWADMESQPRLHAIHFLLHSAIEEFNPAFFYAGVNLRGPGYRPTAADCFPLLGQSHMKGIWFANGTKRDGLTTSPFLSQELAAAILGKRHRLPHRFRPSRPLISYKTRELALDDTTAAEVGGDFMHGLQLPAHAGSSYAEAKREKMKSIYEKRKLEKFGIHPELVHFYESDTMFDLINHAREI